MTILQKISECNSKDIEVTFGPTYTYDTKLMLTWKSGWRETIKLTEEMMNKINDSAWIEIIEELIQRKEKNG